MATLSPEKLAKLRKRIEKKYPLGEDGTGVTYSKPQIDAASQAISTLLTASKTTINNAINNATSPYVLSPAVKKLLVAEVLIEPADRDWETK